MFGRFWVTDRGGREGELETGAGLTTLMRPGRGSQPLRGDVESSGK